MANPITAIASRSCAKNSMLKQTTGNEKDLSKGSETKSVSTTADVQQNIGGGRGIIGDQTDTTITSPGSGGGTETIYDTGKSLKGLTPEQLAWRENEIKKLGGIDEYHRKYGDPKKGKARTIETPGTPGEEKKESEFKMDQEQVKGQENLDLRADIRQEKILNRLDRQAERREDRFERKAITDTDWKGKKDADGNEYKSKSQYKRAMRQQQKIDKAESNIKRQQNVQNLIADRRALRDLQRDQGSFGGEKYYVGKTRETQQGTTNRVLGKKPEAPSTAQQLPSGKTQVGSIIEGIGNVFASKEGGTAVGNTLRDVFGKKEGGSAVGNVLRGIFKEGPAPLKKNYFNK